jgi:NADH dehydrogenase FAD-containing subunit
LLTNGIMKTPDLKKRKYAKPLPSVVIAGANFGGLKAAVSLPKRFNVTVIDPEPYFEFSPNIHELISGLKTPEMLRFSKQKAINRSGHHYLQETVTAILPEQKKIITTSGSTLSYDYCILSIGGQNNTAVVKGAEKHAMPFKSVRQCYDIAKRIEILTSGKRKISIVIAGGGFEGIEALGEILRKYKNSRGLQVHIVEKQKRLMADTPTDIDSEIRRLCNDFPVTFHTGKTITRVWKHSVDLSDKSKLSSQVTIWNIGTRPPDILYESKLTDAPNQWLNVKSTLQHMAYPEIFAAGDIAGMPFPLRKQAYHALDMGKTGAENIIRKHAGRKLKAFKPSSKPMLVSFGDLDAFLIDKKIVVAGPAIGLLKEAVFHYVMTDLDPSGAFLKAIHTSERATAAAIKLASTMTVSPAALAKLGKVRIIK